jgi:hypothetical protein
LLRKREWNREAKWTAILHDLETLDSASTQFDVDFITMANDATSPTFLDRDEVVRFVETYPYLSYIMLQTNDIMAYYVLAANKLSWLTENNFKYIKKQQCKVVGLYAR